MPIDSARWIDRQGGIRARVTIQQTVSGRARLVMASFNPGRANSIVVMVRRLQRLPRERTAPRYR